MFKTCMFQYFVRDPFPKAISRFSEQNSRLIFLITLQLGFHCRFCSALLSLNGCNIALLFSTSTYDISLNRSATLVQTIHSLKSRETLTV